MLLRFPRRHVFFMALFIVATKGWHAKLSCNHAHGVQKVPSEPTPPVGGLALLIGLMVGVWQLLSSEAGGILASLLLASLPALLVGLAEDLTKRVPVLHRLIAALACGLVVNRLLPD